MRLTAKLIFILVMIGIAPLVVGGGFLIHSFNVFLVEMLPPEQMTIAQEFVREITNRYVIFSLVLLMPIALTSFFLSRKVTRPLREISAVARKVARGNFKAKTNISSGDEFGELAESFNKMTEDLEKLQRDLEERKEILEVKVKARTRELEEMNENLENKVKERTKETKKRLAELEKMSKLMVGRELRMKEMKKELEETKKELKELKEKKE